MKGTSSGATKVQKVIRTVKKKSGTEVKAKEVKNIEQVNVKDTPSKAAKQFNELMAISVEGRKELRKVTVTPELALMLLNHMVSNRKVSSKKVSRIKNDIREGRWYNSNILVTRSSDGRLIDGQHRLTAVYELGVTLKMNFMLGEADEAVSAIDSPGTNRTLSQISDIAGLGFTTNQLSAVRGLFLHTPGLGQSVARSLSDQQIFELAEELREGLDLLQASWDRVKTRGYRVTRQQVNTAILQMFYVEYSGERVNDPKRLEEFLTIINCPYKTPQEMSMVQSIEAPEAAMLFRTWYFDQARNNSGKKTDTSCYNKCMGALIRFLDGEIISRIYPYTGNGYVIPQMVRFLKN